MTTRAAPEEDTNPRARKHRGGPAGEVIDVDAPQLADNSKKLTRQDLLCLGPNPWRLIVRHLPPISILSLRHALPYLCEWLPLDLRPYLEKGVTRILMERAEPVFWMRVLLPPKILFELSKLQASKAREIERRAIVLEMAEKIVDAVETVPGMAFVGHFLAWVLQDDPSMPLPSGVHIVARNDLLFIMEHIFVTRRNPTERGIPTYKFPGAFFYGYRSKQHQKQFFRGLSTTFRVLYTGDGDSVFKSGLSLASARLIVKKQLTIPIYSLSQPYLEKVCLCCATHILITMQLATAVKYHFRLGYDVTCGIERDPFHNPEVATLTTHSRFRHVSCGRDTNHRECENKVFIAQSGHWNTLCTSAEIFLRLQKDSGFGCCCSAFQWTSPGDPIYTLEQLTAKNSKIRKRLKRWHELNTQK